MQFDHLRRREFITLLGGAAAWPLAARAQQTERVRRIGVLMSQAAQDTVAQVRYAAFLLGLQQSGCEVGRNVRIETRWIPGSPDHMRKAAAELVALAPDVILATGSASTGPLQQATRSIPIVFVHTPDPVGAGFVTSMSRPGGNATGFTNFEYGMGAKWLELLKQIAPNVARAAIIRDPTITAGIGQWGAVQAVAPFARDRCRPGQHTRERRGRARPWGLGGFPEWRSRRDWERIGDCQSRADRHAGGSAQATRDLL